MNIVEIENLNKNNNFLIYDKNAEKNLVIISACRLSSFAYYFYNLEGFNYNIYMIYVVPYIISNTLPNIEVVNKIFENTDIIVCENIKNHPGLNTSEESKDRTIFDTFTIKKETQIFRIPPLELRCFAHTNFHIFNCSLDNFKSFSDSSKEFLKNRLIRSSFSKTNEFIEKYFETIKLFHSHNHPSNIITIVFFIDFILNNTSFKITKEFVRNCFNVKFLDGNETPIFNIDIINNNYKFIKYVEHDNNFLNKDVLWFNGEKHNYIIERNVDEIIINFFGL